MQGKFALQRLLLEVASDYFPTNPDKAIIAFSNGPLKKPRESLVKNFITVMLKDLVKVDNVNIESYKIKAALYAVKKMHPEWYEITIKEKSSQVLSSIKDDELKIIHAFFRSVSDVWQYLDSSIRLRCENFVENLPKDIFDDIDWYLEFIPLKKSALIRVNKSTISDYSNALFFDLPKEVADKFIKSYLEAFSFDVANSWSKLISDYAADLRPEHIAELIVNISKNSQILSSFELPVLIKKLRSVERIPHADFEVLLLSNGLEKYALNSATTDLL